MNAKCFRLLIGVAISWLAGSVATNGATLEATYTFSGNLNADQGGVPALTATDPLGESNYFVDNVFGQPDTVYRFVGNASPTSQQAGLSLAMNGLVTLNNYSVEMIFSFDGTSGWRRIIDVEDRQSDAGFYVDPSNHLDIFPNAGSGPNNFAPGYHHVILTVASDGAVKGYIDGLTDLVANTSLMNISNSATDTMNFFLDNVAGGGQGEFSDGNIAQLQVYDGVLTDAEALQLSQTPLVLPEPAGMALLGLGAFVCGLRRRQPRN